MASATALEWTRLFGRHYTSTQFDDLFAKLGDREASAVLGRAVLREGVAHRPTQIASNLRSRLANQSIAALCLSEAKSAEIVEASHWVVPESVMLMAVLAALNTSSAS
jgi:hypothetical protein